MKNLATTSILILFTLTGAYQSSPSFSLAISAKDAVVKQGQQIHIKISMTNVSNHNIDCTKLPSNGLDRAFQYDISDANKNKRPKIVRAHPEIGETYNVWPCIIKPGETSEAAGGLVNQVYDMHSPGVYSVQVSRADPDDNGKLVTSNKLNITVEP